MEITHPKIDELEDALHLAFGHLSDMERGARIGAILNQFEAGTLALDGIFQAVEGAERVGVLFSQKRPDGAVMLWAPTMRGDRSAKELFEALERFCRQCGAPAALALVDLMQRPDETALRHAGFDYLSDLLYMASTLVPEETAFDRLQFVPMTEVADSLAAMERLVSATYRNSMDFPRLMQAMPVDKVLEGYRLGAVFKPELWFFIRQHDEDVGVLLMTDQADDQMELTYMGLVEEARGHGLGAEIVRFAERTALRHGRSLLLTGVDHRNAAALQTYLARGFHVWDRKNIHVKLFDAGSES